MCVCVLLLCTVAHCRLRIAIAGHKEGAESVKKFARAGNWGYAAKNLARDLMRQVLLVSCLCFLLTEDVHFA